MLDKEEDTLPGATSRERVLPLRLDPIWLGEGTGRMCVLRPRIHSLFVEQCVSQSDGPLDHLRSGKVSY